jgi:hypothetical protein
MAKTEIKYINLKINHYKLQYNKNSEFPQIRLITEENKIITCQIYSSHGDKHEEGCLLVCCAVLMEA